MSETVGQRETRKEELTKANKALEVAKELENKRMQSGWKWMFLGTDKVLVKPSLFEKKISLGFNFCK